ncbi:MAG TPA: division/cell wall cluster transcriptional repressor MraZ [Anaerolineae bacterium]|nr:division/cell wall cluster transcriptional repressor MraZ [Anaerolineae bacterium]
MFYGEFEHNIDDKGRLTIPAKYRPYLADGLVLTKGLDAKYLLLYPKVAWDTIIKQLSHQSVTRANVRELRRFLLAAASDDVPDRQGRINIPDKLLTYANLDRQAIVIGQFDYCEIWNPADWEEHRALVDSDPEARAAMFESLDLSRDPDTA